MIELDGSFGEGGGQIVRSALSLSMITGKPFEIRKVRANRDKPGLLNQHLTAVKAAIAISTAETSGVELGAKSFSFRPGKVQAGNYRFAIGTAGSTTLVLQTILPALMTAEESSTIILEGGTHNPFAPPFEFLEHTFLPLLKRMGLGVDMDLKTYGFYPRGGGKIRVKIKPPEKLNVLHLADRDPNISISALSLVVNLPEHIGERELKVIKQGLPPLDSREIVSSKNSLGPGNAALVLVKSDQLTETFTSIGKRGVPAETVAQTVVDEAKLYLSSPASTGEHLADQLLMPMALSGGGSFSTTHLSSHATTNMSVIKEFLEVDFETSELSPSHFRILVKR